MSLAKYEVPKFDGKTSFSLKKIRVRLSLVLQELWKAVGEKFYGNMKESKVELKNEAVSAICMSVIDNVL